MKLKNIKNKQKITAALCMALSGGVLAGTADGYVSPVFNVPAAPVMALAQNGQNGQEEQDNEAIKASSPSLPKVLDTASSETVGEEPFIASADHLNLAHFYPEGVECDDAWNSYAGIVYKNLITKESRWMAELYDLSTISPVQMASRLGKPVNQVMGKYNPEEKRHDPKAPETWTINSWKKVNLTFYNGDGKRISGVSNVKDIMSMASVYTYYRDMMNTEIFTQYADALWDQSHSYKMNMGQIYHCDGSCMDDISRELYDLTEGERTIQNDIPVPPAAAAAGTEPSGVASASNSMESTDIPAETSEGAVTAALVDLSGETQEIKTAASVEPVTKSSPGATEAANDSGPRPTTIQVINHEATLEAQESSQAVTSNYVISESESDVMTQQDEAEGTNQGNAGESQPEENSGGPSSEQGTLQGVYCPGHIDLDIIVTIFTLDSKNNLIKKDNMATAKVNVGAGSWSGWTEENLAAAARLNNQDWYKDYNLSVVSVLSAQPPLTAGEIENYMDQLPAGLSQTRKDVIHFALSSVGRVPYYWGGKPFRSNYEGNSYGTIISPDVKGRMLKGLDCSGWINWVYWSATGTRLPYESTSGLVTIGTGIKRDELQPGDIIVRLGKNAHVVMFLGWTEEGEMRCIHESSGKTNNVTISTMEIFWPFYRKLVD